MVKWSKKFKQIDSVNYEKNGKYRNVYASIIYNSILEDFYFCIHQNADHKFNSLSKYKPFKSEKACIIACEEEVERKIEEWFPSK